MRKGTWVLLLLMTACLLGGCSKESAEQTEITLIHGWGSMESEHVRMRQIYKDFEKEHPEIKLNLMSMTSSDEVIKKTKNMLSVGEVPDLIFTGGYGKDSVYRFMEEKNKEADLMPYLEKDQEFADSVAPEIISYWQKDGKLYTLSDVLLLGGGYWYNADIFEKAGIESVPETWDEFLEACEKIQSWSQNEGKSVIPVQITKENSAYLADALLLDTSKEAQDAVENHSMMLSAKELFPVLETMKQIRQYGDSTDKNYGYRDEGSMFNSGNTAMYINGVWASKLIDEKIDACYAPFPGKNGSTIASSSVCLGYIVGNTGNQETMDASVEFLKYMLSEKVQKRILLETGQMPSSPKIHLEEYKEQIPRMCNAVEAIRGADRIIEVPDNLWTADQLENFRNQIMEVLNGTLDEEQFCTNLYQ